MTAQTDVRNVWVRCVCCGAALVTLETINSHIIAPKLKELVLKLLLEGSDGQ